MVTGKNNDFGGLHRTSTMLNAVMCNQLFRDTYMTNDAKFDRLHRAARQGRVTATLLDLASHLDVRHWVQSLPAEERIGLLDLSNTPSSSFVGAKMGQTLQEFASRFVLDDGPAATIVKTTRPLALPTLLMLPIADTTCFWRTHARRYRQEATDPRQFRNQLLPTRFPCWPGPRTR
jgi:hypothetical protein